jgi:hypothetical protein
MGFNSVFKGLIWTPVKWLYIVVFKTVLKCTKEVLAADKSATGSEKVKQHPNMAGKHTSLCTMSQTEER